MSTREQEIRFCEKHPEFMQPCVPCRLAGGTVSSSMSEQDARERLKHVTCLVDGCEYDSPGDVSCIRCGGLRPRKPLGESPVEGVLRSIVMRPAGGQLFRVKNGGASVKADWQPIKTAPWEKAILVASGMYVCVAIHRRDGNGFSARWNGPDADDFTYSGPTHWMPLPDPPGEQG